MGKFKRRTDEQVQVGMGLLNDTSKSYSVERKEETVYIDMDRLQPNSRNEYPMEEIEKLAGMIKLAGRILQNLIVKPLGDDGYYTILTGERRWRAAQLLKERGEYPAEYENKVPCLINDPQKLELQLDEEAKEDFAILVTNQYRTKSDGTLFMEMKKWRNIFSQLRAAGVEWISKDFETESNEGQSAEVAPEERIQIAGTRTRNLVADQLGVSTGTVSTLETIEKRGADSLLEKLVNDEISMSAAKEMVKVDKAEQEKILREIEQEAGPDKNVPEAVEEKLKENGKKITVSKTELQNEIAEALKNVREEKAISESDYKKYKKCIMQLKRLLS